MISLLTCSQVLLEVAVVRCVFHSLLREIHCRIGRDIGVIANGRMIRRIIVVIISFATEHKLLLVKLIVGEFNCIAYIKCVSNIGVQQLALQSIQIHFTKQPKYFHIIIIIANIWNVYINCMRLNTAYLFFHWQINDDTAIIQDENIHICLNLAENDI